jgi:hypothetical protein
MKTLVFGAALFATAATAGSVAYVLARQPASARAVETATLPERSSAPADASPLEASPGVSTQLSDLRDDLARLRSTVQGLQAEVESLRSASTRESMSPEPQAGSSQPVAIAREQVEQSVRDVLAAERQRQQQQEEQERIERERQAANRMAERVGERLSLAPADTTRLATHLIAAQDKRNLLMQQMREGGLERDDMRSSFEELRTWNQTELQRLFGADLGGQIAEQTNNLGGRGGFGGGQGERRNFRDFGAPRPPQQLEGGG